MNQDKFCLNYDCFVKTSLNLGDCLINGVRLGRGWDDGEWTTELMRKGHVRSVGSSEENTVILMR